LGPPSELRARVLAAARRAEVEPQLGLLAALYHDRLLRVCAAGLVALAAANALVVPGSPAPSLSREPAAFRADDGAIPGDSGLTLADQLDDLAPVLGPDVARSRG
jgi:hypothetical protein